MSIKFETSNSTALLAAFKKAIDDGKVVTWSYDGDGDFTHTPPQWNKKALFASVCLPRWTGNEIPRT